MTESSTRENPLRKVDQLAAEIRDARNKPLLVLYYPDIGGYVSHLDVRDIHDEFRRRDVSRNRKLKDLDVILHTYGGDPNAAYRIGQVVRDFAKAIDFLIPFHAHSAGTLMCFCADRITLGAYAVLGPIDITLDGIELASIDYYMEFAKECRERIEEMLSNLDHESDTRLSLTNPRPTTNVERHLLVEMVRQIGALNVGRFFRERTVTGRYANRLLFDYMLRDHTNKETLSGDISSRVLFEFPSHDFDMDYHICKDLNLPVFEMTDKESDNTKLLINKLDDFVDQGVICRQLEEELKAPFIRLYMMRETF